MPLQTLTEIPIWNKLKQQAEIISQPENHLKYLIRQEQRLEKFSRSQTQFGNEKRGGIFYDFSRQRVDEKTMELLLELAEERKLQEVFQAMISGEKINNTEGRAALHTASRNFSDEPIWVDDKDVMPEIRDVRNKIRAFSERIHSGEITGTTGKRFEHLVVIGIGGSYLGTEFVSEALSAYVSFPRKAWEREIEIHYLANVDIHNFGKIVSRIEPETTLWIVVSKSYTTAETSANTNQAYEFMKQKGLDPAKHVVTVTAKGSPGDDPANPVLAAFHMFDFIGGRYSVTSAVGGVPLSLCLGYDAFEQFLKGAEEMDIHVRNAPANENLPLIAALISIWNNNFLGYPAQAIIPYAQPLCKLAPHVQQLYMESNGKSITKDGEFLQEQTGVIVFGEPGTGSFAVM